MLGVSNLFFAPQNLYDSIRNEPFKIPEDDGNDLTHTFFNPDREGWLLKLGTSLPEPVGNPAGSPGGLDQDRAPCFCTSGGVKFPHL